MDEAYVVRHKVLVEGVPIRRVAREIGISRNTVRRYVAGAPPGLGKPRGRAGKPVADAVRERAEAILGESPRWTGGKQRLTAARLHEMLRVEGHEVGETVVKEIVREWRRRKQEVFVPLVYRAGDLAEQELVPIPSGETLDAISGELLERLDRRALEKRDRDGVSIAERFLAERGAMLPLPARPFRAAKTQLVCATRRSLVDCLGRPRRDRLRRRRRDRDRRAGRRARRAPAAEVRWTLRRLPALRSRARAEAAGAAPGRRRTARSARRTVLDEVAPARRRERATSGCACIRSGASCRRRSRRACCRRPIAPRPRKRRVADARGAAATAAPAGVPAEQLPANLSNVDVGARALRTSTCSSEVRREPRRRRLRSRSRADEAARDARARARGRGAVEIVSRSESAIRQRLRDAKFPASKTLDQFDFTAADGLAAAVIAELARGGWLDRTEDVLLAGPIGTGKTHLAIALGIEAARQRRHVGFFRAAELVPRGCQRKLGARITGGLAPSARRRGSRERGSTPH